MERLAVWMVALLFTDLRPPEGTSPYTCVVFCCVGVFRVVYSFGSCGRIRLIKEYLPTRHSHSVQVST